MSCKYSALCQYVDFDQPGSISWSLTFLLTGWLLLKTNCLCFKQLLLNPAPPTLQPLPYTRPLISRKHDNMPLPLPNTLTLQPTVENLGCNPGFQNAPLMTVHPQRVSNRVETQQLSCPRHWWGRTSGAAPLLPSANSLWLIFSLSLFLSLATIQHILVFVFFFCCSSASRLWGGQTLRCTHKTLRVLLLPLAHYCRLPPPNTPDLLYIPSAPIPRRKIRSLHSWR